MADTAEIFYDQPNWSESGNAAQVAMIAMRRSVLWTMPHLWFKSTGAGAGKLVGHSGSNSGDGPELSWVQTADASGSGYAWRANLTWTSGEITGISFEFNDGGGLVALGSPQSTLLDDTDTNSFLFDPRVNSFYESCNTLAKRVRENLMSLSVYSAMRGKAYQSYLLTGYTQTITGDITAPTQIDLGGGTPFRPDIRYTFSYTSSGRLWRIKIETRRKDTEAFYVLDHLEYRYDVEGRLKTIRSANPGAPGLFPGDRYGLDTVTASFSPKNSGNTQAYNWLVPAETSGNTIFPIWLEPIGWNHLFLLCLCGWGGEDPYLYKMPRLATGYTFIRFFYANDSDGDAGMPAAVEMQQGQFCIRYEITYSGGNIASAEWYANPAAGMGWLHVGSLT